MNAYIDNYIVALPEIVLLIMICLVLLTDLFLSEKTRVITLVLSLLSLVLVAGITLQSFDIEEKTLAFSGTFVRDPMGDVLKIFIYIVVFAVFVYSQKYLKERNLFKGEFYLLGLFATLGMLIMVSANSMLTIYLGLELLSLSMYAMVAMNRDSLRSSEAAMKYFILGAMASGMLLYGMSLIYGLTGSLNLNEIHTRIFDNQDILVQVFALSFLIVGIAFKLGAVPFHMWVPDVYHGAPTAMTMFIGSAPKIAAFAMLMRLLVDGLQGLHEHWQDMLAVIAILSLALGNIVAIAQTNLKRMLAYSTIAHVGFLILGVLSGTQEGYSASMFYALTYALMSVGAFGMIILLSRNGFEADEIDDFKGLNQRSPWFAFMMLILMFSMAGVPPFVGFWAKLSVLKEVVQADMVWLAIIAVFFSIIGAFYYLRMIKVMYFDNAEDENPITADIASRVIISINGMAILVLGLMPSYLIKLCLDSLSLS